MRNLKLTVAYEGTMYAGWQRQPDRPTIQGELQTAFARLTGQQVTLNGAGRTDAGVHALGQVANFRTESPLPTERLLLGLNHFLPDDIAVQSLVEVADDFHATLSARRKTYRYVIHPSRVRDPFSRRFAWRVSRPLNISAMRDAAVHLIGRHDFQCFETQGSPRADTVRTLFDARVLECEAGWPAIAFEGSADAREVHRDDEKPTARIAVEVTGDGFLYNMVRTIAGTLAEVGWGKQPPGWVADLIRGGHRPAAGQTAPPQGLFLMRVDYETMGLQAVSSTDKWE